MGLPRYDAGDTVRAFLSVRDFAGVAVDPGALLGKVRNPAGTVTTYTYGVDAEVVKSSTGEYYLEIAIPAAAASEGTWAYRFEATGANAGAVEQAFIVNDSAFYS